MRAHSACLAVAVAAGGLASIAQAQPVEITKHERVINNGLKQLWGVGGGDSVGPDVIVGELHSSQSSTGSMNVSISPSSGTPVGGIAAYGIGTSSCNRGDMNLNWIANSPNHPVIPQNMYRLKTVNGSTRFEQIGQSWMKFAFTALTYNACNLGCNGQGGAVLGIGCSDPYTASRNATQSSLGPRYTTNPFSGDFPDGSSSWRTANWPPTGDASTKRIRVATTDLNVANHPGALFFAEAMYVTPDDAKWGNGYNNSSYRRFTVAPTTWTITLVDTTQRMKSAINAWKDHGLGLNQSDPGVMLTSVDSIVSFNPPSGQPVGDGIVVVGSKATDLGGGMWHYEYAVENLTSDRGIASFSVNIPSGAVVSNAEVRQVNSHSGIAAEDVDRNTPWRQVLNFSSVGWETTTSYSAASVTAGSYLRWGTLYNFRFDANVPPVNTGSVSMNYYKPGTPTSITATAWVPGTLCYANCDGSTAGPFLNVNDFACFTNRFAAGDSWANCDQSVIPPVLNINDFICFFNQYAAGCANP